MPGPSGPRVFFIVFLFALPFTRPDTEAFRAYSPEAVHARLAQETGLQTVISVLEGLRFPDGLPAHCRRHSDSGTAPLCLSPDHLALPDVYVPFPTFLAEGAAPPPCGKAPYFPACPHVDGLGFKELADLAWHTAAMFFPNQTNPERLDPKAIANRSLVYWNIGVYSSKKGTDLMHLNRMLPHIDSHFFILHHNYDNPRFPNWLLDSPKILRIFSINVPSWLTHPKVIPLPLGLAPIGPSVKLRLAAAHRSFATRAPGTLLMAKGFTLGAPSIRHTQGLPRFINRRMWLRTLGPRFNFSLSDATGYVAPEEYYATMREAQFVLSLPGTGLDCFRTWESLYVGRPPVVSDRLSPAEFTELPVLRANPLDVVPSMLEGNWSLLSQPARRYNVGRLSMQWWVARILQECLMVP